MSTITNLLNRRELLHLGGAVLATAGLGRAADEYHIFWGDLHCHSNLSYGEGDPEEGLKAAREHLDFATITAHAAWPDIPNEPGRLGWVTEYHNRGFERVRKLWPSFLQMMRGYRGGGKFISFPSYEWHSMKYGDHHVVWKDFDAELVLPDTLEELKAGLRGRNVVVVPHHIGYQTGYRGINWEHYTPELSPVVEVTSKHGTSVTDYSPNRMLHDMGPRVVKGTAVEGLSRGYHFGFIGSSDNHSGFPGSYGEGRMAVLAKSLTADDLFEAIENRRTYAATGDRIEVDFRANGELMGRKMPNAPRKTVSFRVRGEDFIDYADIVKNGFTVRRYNGVFPGSTARRSVMGVKFRIEWGWGSKSERTKWDGECRLSDGKIRNVTPYFRGQLLLAPRQDHEQGQKQFTPIHTIRDRTEKGFTFHSYTYGNPNTLTPATSSVVVEAEMPLSGRLDLRVNGKAMSFPLSDLLEGARAEFVRGWLSEAVHVHRAVPEQAQVLEGAFDDAGDGPVYYFLRVRQYNGQYAWSSPITFRAG